MRLNRCGDVDELIPFLKQDYANNLYFFTYIREIAGSDPQVSVLVGRESGRMVLAALTTPIHFCITALDDVYIEMAARRLPEIESIHVLGKAEPVRKILGIIKTPVRKIESYILCRLSPDRLADQKAGESQKAGGEDLADLICFYQANDMLLNCESRLEAVLGWGTIYLLRQDGRIVSCALTTTETKDSAMLGAVFTEPDYRRKGYSSSCCVGLCRELAEKGKDVYLFYKNSDASLAEMYGRLGFQPADSWVLATRADI